MQSALGLAVWVAGVQAGNSAAACGAPGQPPPLPPPVHAAARPRAPGGGTWRGLAWQQGRGGGLILPTLRCGSRHRTVRQAAAALASWALVPSVTAAQPHTQTWHPPGMSGRGAHAGRLQLPCPSREGRAGAGAGQACRLLHSSRELGWGLWPQACLPRPPSARAAAAAVHPTKPWTSPAMPVVISCAPAQTQHAAASQPRRRRWAAAPAASARAAAPATPSAADAILLAH